MAMGGRERRELLSLISQGAENTRFIYSNLPSICIVSQSDSACMVIEASADILACRGIPDKRLGDLTGIRILARFISSTYLRNGK